MSCNDTPPLSNIRICSEDPGKFSARLIQSVIEDLHDNPLPDLTPLEHEHLIVLIQTRLEVSSLVILILKLTYFDRLKNKEGRSMEMGSAILSPCALSTS